MTSPPRAQSTPGRRRGFVANMLIVSGGSVAGQAASLVTAPIIARLFPPEAFGIGAIYATLCVIVGVVGCLRYDNAIPLPKEHADRSAVLGVSIAIAIAVSLVTALVMSVAGGTILRSVGADALVPHLWIVPVGILLTTLHPPLALYFQRHERFATVAGIRLIASLSGISCVIVVGSLGWQTGRDLVFARSATLLLIVPLFFLLLMAWRPTDVAWARPSIARMRGVAWRYRHFPLVNSWAALLDVLAREAPPLILAALYSPAVVGIYAMAQRLIGLPAQFISTAVAQVFFQRAATEQARGDTLAFARSVQQVAERLIAVGTLPVLLIALLLPALVSIVFGRRWEDAGLYVALLAPVNLSMFVTSPMTVLLNVLELHRFNVAMQGSMLILRAGGLSTGMLIWGTPEAALGLYAVVVPLGLLVQQTVLLRASGARPGAFYAHLGRHLAYALPCAAAWLVADRLLELPYPVVVLATFVGASPYVLLAAREDPALVDVVRRVTASLGDRTSR